MLSLLGTNEKDAKQQREKERKGQWAMSNGIIKETVGTGVICAYDIMCGSNAMSFLSIFHMAPCALMHADAYMRAPISWEHLHGATTILRHWLLSQAGLQRVQRVTAKGWVTSTTHDTSHTLPAMFRGRNCNSCKIAWTAFMDFFRHHHWVLCGAIDRITSLYRRCALPRDEKPLEGYKSLRNAYLELFNAVNWIYTPTDA